MVGDHPWEDNRQWHLPPSNSFVSELSHKFRVFSIPFWYTRALQEGKRLWENQAHHFRDLCWVGALSGLGGK